MIKKSPKITKNNCLSIRFCISTTRTLAAVVETCLEEFGVSSLKKKNFFRDAYKFRISFYNLLSIFYNWCLEMSYGNLTKYIYVFIYVFIFEIRETSTWLREPNKRFGSYGISYYPRNVWYIYFYFFFNIFKTVTYDFLPNFNEKNAKIFRCLWVKRNSFRETCRP